MKSNLLCFGSTIRLILCRQTYYTKKVFRCKIYKGTKNKTLDLVLGYNNLNGM